MVLSPAPRRRKASPERARPDLPTGLLAGSALLEEHVAQERQAVVAPEEAAPGDEARHAEHFVRERIGEGRGERPLGRGLAQRSAKGRRVEPGLAGEPDAGLIVERRGSAGEQGLEQTTAEGLDGAEPGGGSAASARRRGSKRTSTGSR